MRKLIALSAVLVMGALGMAAGDASAANKRAKDNKLAPPAKAMKKTQTKKADPRE